MGFSQIIMYAFTFIAVYVQVFFLITYIERKKDLILRRHPIKLLRYPKVTILVPCYNEEKTLYGTVRSLLDLDYPKDKLEIILIDDGSKDNTWKIIERFTKYKNISAIKKENGGKHTAMNLGIERATGDFIGGLDADSFVDPEALKRIITYFNDPETMAVAPSIIVHKPKNILQKAQKIEYDMAVYTKKMLAFLGAIHVTPGPFSIFRKKVFQDLGSFRKAHNTEDQEIALRMQENGYKIEHCPDAYVYTVSPNTVPKLYRQRLRWIYGFIKNAIDYRHIIFRKRYGNVGILTIPSGVISVLSVIFLFSFFVYNLSKRTIEFVEQYQATGVWWSFGVPQFDLFFVSTKAIVFVMILLYILIILALLVGRSMTEGRVRVSLDILYFLIIYSVLAPFWLLKAIWNALWSKESSWTFERRVQG